MALYLTTMNAIDKFYDKQEEPNKSCFIALRKIVLDHDKNIAETVKYGMPCFTIKGKPLCYLWQDKKTLHPYILMAEGKLLKHPQLVQGDRKRMKTFTVDPNKDLPVETIHEILQEGISLYS